MTRKSDLNSPTIIGFLWANRSLFKPGLTFALARILSVAPFPIIFKHILDHYMPEKNLPGIYSMVILMIALLCLHQFLIVKGATKIGKASTILILRLRAEIFHKIQYLSFSYLDRQKTGRLLSKYAFDTQKVEGLMMPILNSFIPNAFYSILTLATLVVLNWQLSLVMVLLLPIVLILRNSYFEKLQEHNEATRVAQEKMTGNAAELLGALRLMRSYGEEQQARSQLHEDGKHVARARVNMIGTSTGFNALSFASIQFLSLVVVAGGAILAVHGQITAGTVLAFVSATGPLVQPIQMFTQLSDQYFMGQDAYTSLRELLGEPELEPWQGTKTLDKINGAIDFEHVSFRYTGADRDALHDFHLSIRSGEKIALVGSSGAGKTTVSSLLLGLYAATSGQIRVDGVPQSELDMRWLRQHTALVMQESILLSGSIEDNIRFGRADATDAEVREAIRQAHAEEFISKLPDGIKTIVGERGAMLSGGQRQRLSIARALLRDPAILILDEPTSALDYESERLIQEALDTLTEGRTVITIAHRLSTIRSADRVLVLSDGQVVEQGNFAELWEQKGFFYKMMLAQGANVPHEIDVVGMGELPATETQRIAA